VIEGPLGVGSVYYLYSMSYDIEAFGSDVSMDALVCLMAVEVCLGAYCGYHRLGV
jgi:hypothetical protein